MIESKNIELNYCIEEKIKKNVMLLLKTRMLHKVTVTIIFMTFSIVCNYYYN